MAKYKTFGARLNEQNSRLPNNWNFFSVLLTLVWNFTTFVVGKIKKTASNALRWRPNSHFVYRRIGVTSWKSLGKTPGVVVWCRNRIRHNNHARNMAILKVVVWCRNRIRHNGGGVLMYHTQVVVWCRNRIRHNAYAGGAYLSTVVVWCRNRIRHNLYGNHQS